MERPDELAQDPVYDRFSSAHHPWPPHGPARDAFDRWLEEELKEAARSETYGGEE